MRAPAHSTEPMDRDASAHHGQALVEFALILPVFLLLVFGVVDGGRYVFANSAISNAAREAARLGSVEASWMGSSDASCSTAGGPVCPSDATALLADITAAANRQMAPFGSVTAIHLDCQPSSGTPPTGAWTRTAATSNCGTAANRASGGYLSVRVTFTWRAITPIVGNVMGVITSSASSTVTIN